MFDMNFKKFILKEGFDSSNVEAGDILSALQGIKTDIDNIKRKDLISAMEDLVVKIRTLLNPKNDPRLILVIQKIAAAIIDDIEQSGDFKETIESSIFELENYFKNKKVVLNKPAEVSKDIKGTSDPVTPKDIKKNPEVGSPPEENSSYIPPLSGSGENSAPIV
jgi:hypothetical protein